MIEEMHGLMPFYRELAWAIIERAAQDYVEFQLLPDYTKFIGLADDMVNAIGRTIQEGLNVDDKSRRSMFDGWAVYNNHLPEEVRIHSPYIPKAMNAQTMKDFMYYAKAVYNAATLRRTEVYEMVNKRFFEPPRIEAFFRSERFRLYCNDELDGETIIEKLQEQLEEKKNEKAKNRKPGGVAE